MKKWIVLSLTIFGFLSIARGQNIHINESADITRLMDKYEARNRATDELVGYRIQLIATTERRLMESTKERFAREFPRLKSTWFHKSPYYQLQAGTYATKQEALPELGRIKEKFPRAYLIVDRIKKEEILARL